MDAKVFFFECQNNTWISKGFKDKRGCHKSKHMSGNYILRLFLHHRKKSLIVCWYCEWHFYKMVLRGYGLQNKLELHKYDVESIHRNPCTMLFMFEPPKQIPYLCKCTLKYSILIYDGNEWMQLTPHVAKSIYISKGSLPVPSQTIHWNGIRGRGNDYKYVAHVIQTQLINTSITAPQMMMVVAILVGGSLVGLLKCRWWMSLMPLMTGPSEVWQTAQHAARHIITPPLEYISMISSVGAAWPGWDEREMPQGSLGPI